MADGKHAKGKPDVFGPFALYLMLASRSDPVATLAIADGWAGDAMVTFHRGDAACIRATFAGRTNEAAATLGDLLARWAPRGRPERQVSSAPMGRTGAHDRRSRRATPAPRAAASAASGDGSLAALTVAAFRNQLLATVIKEGADLKVANCTANGVIRDPRSVRTSPLRWPTRVRCPTPTR